MVLDFSLTLNKFGHSPPAFLFLEVRMPSRFFRFLFGLVFLPLVGQSQPLGVLSSPFNEGSPFARLPDGASAFGVPYLSPSQFATSSLPGSEGGVHTFTGQSGFSIPLAGISNKGRVGYTVQFNYSGKTREQVRNDFVTSPTGWISLGWTCEAPYIARNPNGTFGTQDDVFYADLGSLGKGQLVRGVSGKFYLADNPYLIFTPDSASGGVFSNQFEQWTVKLGNGTVYQFGNKNTLEDNSEREIYHTNGFLRVSPWSIGNANTERFIYRWDLHRISDAEGVNQLEFDYQKFSVDIFGGSKDYTRESHLKSIVARGRDGVPAESLAFISLPKRSTEWLAPSPNLFLTEQELYETQALDTIKVFQSGILSTQYIFWHDFVGSGRYYRRLLREIEIRSRLSPESPTFYNAPSWKFTYESTRERFYMLKTVTNPAGAQTEFQYALASLGTEASQPAYDNVLNRLKDSTKTEVTFPSTNPTTWENQSSCGERFCFNVAKDGDKVGGKIFLEARLNRGNYFDTANTYRKHYTSPSSTVSSNWKWASNGDYFVVYNAADTSVYVHEWDGVTWTLKTKANFGPVAGSSTNTLSVYPSRNFFVVYQKGSTLNKVWVYIKRGTSWVRLNQTTPCDIDNNANYGETVKNSGYGCLDFNSTLKVGVSETMFTLVHDATDIIFAYALNKLGNNFTNVSGNFLSFGGTLQLNNVWNNWNLDITDIRHGPDYFLVHAASGAQMRVDAVHYDGFNFRQVASTGLENGSAADMVTVPTRDYFLQANHSTGLINFWMRTPSSTVFAFTKSATPVRTGLPARTSARLTMRAFPEAFTIEYGRLTEDIGGGPIPTLNGTDFNSYLYQVDPSATGGYLDRSTDLAYTPIVGGTTKLFNVILTPDNFLGGMTLRNSSSLTAACPVAGTCTPYFASKKVRRKAESTLPFLYQPDSLFRPTGTSQSKYIRFSVGRSSQITLFDPSTQRVKYRLFAWDGDNFRAAPDSVYVLRKTIAYSGVNTTGLGASPNRMDSLSYDFTNAEYNSHLQAPEFPICIYKQVDSSAANMGRTEIAYNLDMRTNRLIGQSFRLNGTVKQQTTFNKAGNTISTGRSAYLIGSSMIVPSDWPGSVSVNRLDTTIAEDRRPNGTRMLKRTIFRNYNNRNGSPHFTKQFRDTTWQVSQTIFNDSGRTIQTVGYDFLRGSSKHSDATLNGANVNLLLDTLNVITSTKLEYDPANPYFMLKDSAWRDVDESFTDDSLKAGKEPKFNLKQGWMLSSIFRRRNSQNQVQEIGTPRDSTDTTYSTYFYEGRRQSLAAQITTSRYENCAVLLMENAELPGPMDLDARWVDFGGDWEANQFRSGRYSVKVNDNRGPTIKLTLRDVRKDKFGYVVSAWILNPQSSSGANITVLKKTLAGATVATYEGSWVPQEITVPPEALGIWKRYEARIPYTDLIAGNMFNAGSGDYLEISVGFASPVGDPNNHSFVDDIVCVPDQATFTLSTYDYRGILNSQTDTFYRTSFIETDFMGSPAGSRDARSRIFGQGAVHLIGEN